MPRQERGKLAAEAANNFAKLYTSKLIYVPEATATKLDEFNQELKAAFIEFAFGVDMMRDPNSIETTKKWVEVGNKLDRLSKAPHARTRKRI